MGTLIRVRVLHIVKTSEGAAWAALQAAHLVHLGAEIHVALPDATGRMVPEWRAAGATIHAVPLDFPATAPWRLHSAQKRAARLVDEVKPDLIHTHHVGPTLLLRMALGKRHPIPRIFQVPGPLHMEHVLYRAWELRTAGPGDRWIASSAYTKRLYDRAGVPREKLFLSYSGTETSSFECRRSGLLRQALGIGPDQLVVGNVNYFYAPKYYLGQRVGLKCHEDIIEALSIVVREREDVIGLLVGGPWGKARAYHARLRARAEAAGRGRILLPGHLPHDQVQRGWPDFDCAVHVPLSENCGGVVEPLLAGVPTIAGSVGGLPEVIVDGATGRLVSTRKPRELAAAILGVLGDLARFRIMAETGRRLVRHMFDIRRTAAEVHQVYRHVLCPSEPAPVAFDSRQFLELHDGVLSLPKSNQVAAR